MTHVLFPLFLALPIDSVQDDALTPVRQEGEFALAVMAETLRSARTAAGTAVGRHDWGRLDGRPERDGDHATELRLEILPDRDAGATRTDLHRTLYTGAIQRRQHIALPDREIRLLRLEPAPGYDAEPVADVGVTSRTAAPITWAGGRSPNVGPALDIHTLALVPPRDRRVPLEEVLREFRDRLPVLETIEKGADDVWTLIFHCTIDGATTPGGLLQVWELRLDAGRAFLPVGSRTFRAFALLPTVALETLDSATITWHHEAGGWVPETVHLENHQGREEPETLDLAFDWLMVNEPVPATQFEWQTFDLPPDTGVTDTRLGVPIEIGRSPKEGEATGAAAPAE